MHIPSEFSYIPILFSACFVVPCIYGKSKSPAKSVTVGCFILFKSFLCFTTIVAVDPCRCVASACFLLFGIPLD